MPATTARIIGLNSAKPETLWAEKAAAVIIATSTIPGMTPFHTEPSRFRPTARSAEIMLIGISFASWAAEDNAILHASTSGECHPRIDLSNELFLLK